MAEENNTGSSTPKPVTSTDIGQWLLNNAEQKGSDDFNLMVSEYDRLVAAEQAAQPPAQFPTAPENQEMGFFEGIGEAFTGERRATDLTRTLPSYQRMPEFNGIRNFFSLPQFKTAIGTIMGNPAEMAQVIKANYPQINVRYDERGNPILRSSVDNKEYVIAPGMELSDIPRAGAAASLFALTKGRGILGSVAQGAGTQAAYEGVQSTVGGEFGIGEVATAGAVPGAFATVGAGIRALKPYFQNIFPRLFSPTISSASKITNPNLTAQESADLARKAANGDTVAMRLLAEDAAPDAATIAAAQRLGIVEYLQPDHVTTNQSFRQLAQLAKSQAGSVTRREEMLGLQQVGERAFQLVDDLGGTPDLSTLNATVRNRMNTSLQELDTAVNTAWDSLRTLVPPTTRSTPVNVISRIEARAVELGGEEFLSPLEKDLLSKLRPANVAGPTLAPTYGLIDNLRREVGRATQGRGAFGTEDTGLAKQLYAALLADIDDLARSIGPEAAQSFTTARAVTATQKSLQDDLVSLFGRDISRTMVDDLAGAVKGLAKGDADRFTNLLNAVPRDLRRQVVVSGITSAFGKATQNGQLNFLAYTQWYEGLLRNRTAYRTLIGNLPRGAQKQFSDLYRVSRGILLSTREFSNNGKSLQTGMFDADTALQRLYGVAKRAAIGIPVEAAATATGFPGMGVASGITSALMGGKKPVGIQAVDNMLVSPQFRNMVASAGTADEIAAARALANTGPFKRFASAINLPLSESEKFILSIFQSGAQANRPEEAPAEEPVAPPQARALPPAPSTRGLGTMLQGPAPGGAPAPAPAPGPVAQGPAAPSSREMLQDLFPFDTTLRAG
jgi:hypothetical protein